MTLFWFWAWFMTVMATPSLVWQDETADPGRWKNTRTEGFVVLPFAQSTFDLAPTPLVWEVRSVDGKAHLIRIVCDLYGDVMYESEWLVESIVSGSTVIPIQAPSDYDQLQCVVYDEQRRKLQSVSATTNLSGIVDHSKTLFIDSSQSRERFPEWMISTELHRMDEDLIHVSETSWLPSDVVAYMGIRTVVWFANERPLSSLQETTLRDWVHFGGHLIVVGTPNFRNRSEWGTLIHERFDLSTLDESVLPFMTVQSSWFNLKGEYSLEQHRQFKKLVDMEYPGTTSVEAYRVGRGRLTLAGSSISVQEAFVLLMDPWGNQTGFFSGFRKERGEIVVETETIHPFFEGYFYGMNDLIKGLGLFELVPEEVIVFLLFIFSMIIGPINMAMKGSRLHWVWRTPLIAMVCTLIVLMINWTYTTAARGKSVEFAMWDARSEEVLVRKERLYFVNSSELETEPVTAHTRLLPIREDGGNIAILKESKDGSTWEDLSKMRQVQPLLSWHKLPQRRGVRVDNGTVFNDLDVPLDQVTFRDADGEYWVSSEISAGSSQQLTELLSPWQFRSFFPEVWKKHELLNVHWNNMAKNTILFVLNEKVIWDGLESTNGNFDQVDGAISDVHTIVYGVLP